MEVTVFTKTGLTTLVNNLNEIISSISCENCYSMVVKFFTLTSMFEDYESDIKKLPLKGWQICGVKSNTRKEAESSRDFFFKEVRKAGREPHGHNRTEPGEVVTENNVFFGDVFGIFTKNIADFSACKDEYVQQHIRNQIVGFVKSYNKSFKVDWLK